MLAELGARVRTLAGRAATAGTRSAPEPAAALATPTLAPDALQLGTAGFGDAIRGRRILVLTMNNGGHLALARSIEREVAAIDPSATVQVVDGWSKPSTGWFRRTIAKIHSWELEHTPWTYEAQHKLRYTRTGIQAERALNTRAFRGEVERAVADFRPDVIVSTHERLTSPLGAMRRSGDLQVPVVVALADANPHGMWLAPGADQHVLYNASDLPRLGAVFAGGPNDALHAVAARPPVDPRALMSYDRAAVRTAFGLPTDRRVALVSGGSTGMPVPDADIGRLLEQTDFHLAIPTGRNEASLRHLARTFPADRVTPIPFTSEMPALLASSDVAVLNANGATSVEAFAARTPVVVFNPVAGHGVTSAKAIDADELATHAEDVDQLVDALRRVDAGDPEIAQRVANARALFDRPLSYGDVIVGARLAS